MPSTTLLYKLYSYLPVISAVNLKQIRYKGRLCNMEYITRVGTISPRLLLPIPGFGIFSVERIPKGNFIHADFSVMLSCVELAKESCTIATLASLNLGLCVLKFGDERTGAASGPRDSQITNNCAACRSWSSAVFRPCPHQYEHTISAPSAQEKQIYLSPLESQASWCGLQNSGAPGEPRNIDRVFVSPTGKSMHLSRIERH
jgi:hypothetical protein